MPTKEFVITSKQLSKRLISEVQHKLRIILKCYTIYDFQLINPDNRDFTFKKSHVKRLKFRKKIRFNDPKEYSGTYNVVDLGDNKHKLEITVFPYGEERQEN